MARDGDPERAAPPRRAKEHSSVRDALLRAVREFRRDNGLLLAAAVAFYVLLSLIPLLMLATALAGTAMRADPQHAAQVVLRLAGRFLPLEESAAHHLVRELIARSAGLGAVGLAAAALAGTAGFSTLENAIYVMWNRRRRGFFLDKLRALGMVLVTCLLLLLALGITSAVQWASGFRALGWLASSWSLLLLGYLLPLLLTIPMFTLIYRLHPARRGSWRPSLQAAVVTALAFEALKLAFTLYLRWGEPGAYGAVIALVTWIFCSCVATLFGSELAWVLEPSPGGGAGESPGRD